MDGVDAEGRVDREPFRGPPVTEVTDDVPEIKHQSLDVHTPLVRKRRRSAKRRSPLYRADVYCKNKRACLQSDRPDRSQGAVPRMGRGTRTMIPPESVPGAGHPQQQGARLPLIPRLLVGIVLFAARAPVLVLAVTAVSLLFCV